MEAYRRQTKRIPHAPVSTNMTWKTPALGGGGRRDQERFQSTRPPWGQASSRSCHAILVEEFRALDTLPSLVTSKMALGLSIDASAQISLRTQPVVCENVVAKDGEGDP